MAQGGYLVTDAKGNTHLPTESDGKIDHHLMGAAWAALHEGYRGKKYEGPNKSEAIAKLRKLYEREGMKPPGSSDKETASAIYASLIPLGDKAPEWIELIPVGKFELDDGRGEFDTADPESVMAASKTIGRQTGIPIDYDHATEFAAPEGRPAPAAGWITDFQVRNGGIWGKVDWTTAGAAKVTTKEYRYISPHFEYSKKTRRVMLIRRAALTNNPAILMSAIAARNGGDDDEREAAMATSDFRSKMCSALGAKEDMSDDDVLAMAKDFMSKLKKHEEGEKKDKANASREDDDQVAARLIASGKVVSHEQHSKLVTEVGEIKASRAKENAEREVDSAIAAGKIIPAQREWAISYCSSDAAGFKAFVEKQPAIQLGADGSFKGPLPDKRAAGLSEAEIATAARLRLTPEQMAASKKQLIEQGQIKG